MNNLEKIKTICASIRSVNKETRVRRGISKKKIFSSFKSVGLTPPSELVELYNWHNGIYGLNPFLEFYSLEDSLEQYCFNKQLKSDIPDFQWKKNWHTVLDQNADIQICLDLKTLELYSVDVECSATTKIAEHYSHYLDAMLFLFQSGQYTFNTECKYFEVREEVWKEIAEKYKIKSIWV
ncbi:hypothetical protein IQ249_10000 [Lusitaniella coriacea LEGE 07157]|uniref:SMI1/KNR4 family protein n=1 Tax=Lusitaniella coriacea LEGE 07157 TaxID=945747 RepID=A0A8J7DW45_9CYAN|nr:SMI1/KNR4 family protein [Lusitaniella coriacea]MBE9116227.1 hypothetical protein [Lusitaniella coriacea LEGE 07157]